MNTLVLDFETYFDREYSLKKKLSIPEYVHDPRFHVLGLALQWPDGRTEFRTDVRSALNKAQKEFGDRLEDTTVVGHHLQFDLYILNYIYGVRPRFFVDTKLLAHHILGRRDHLEGQDADLGSLAAHYGLTAKGDLDFMAGVRNPDAWQLAELAKYARNDALLTAQLAERMLPEIMRPEVELSLLMHTVRMFTERAIRVDVAGIDRLIQEVRESTEEALEAAGVTGDEVSRNGEFVPRLTAALANSGRTVPMKEGKRGLIPATAKADAAMQSLLQDNDSSVATLTHARVEKKGEDQKLARLEKLKRITAATGGWLPPYLTYYGAHTGRFAGGGGFNLQNLGRDGLGGRIRNLLLPRPGSRFVVADLAQIEARITAWYAGEREMLAAFVDNRDLYSEFATQVFGQEVRKPRESDTPEDRTRLLALRQVGKLSVLGLGFQLGARTFMKRLEADPIVARLFHAGVLNPLRCREIVDAFRDAYPEIPGLWEDLGRQMFAAVDGMPTDGPRYRTFQREDVTHLQLPSGRTLRYPRLRLDHTPRTIRYIDADGLEDEFTPEGPSLVYGNGTTLYGGKLCENMVQATARDILVEAILRLESRGLPVLFHVHDEVIVEVPEGKAEQALQIVEAELSRTPDWAKGLPVACEVAVAERYGK